VHLATTVLLWRLLRRHRPHVAVPGTLFYAWNPLVLLEVVGNAHNDGLVALFAVALAGAAMRRAWIAAAVAGACAVMVKPFAVVLLPVLARQVAPFGREDGSWRPVAAAATAGCATLAALSLPLWAGLALVRNTLANPAATMQTNSLWEVASRMATDGLTIAQEAQQPYLTALRAALFLGGTAWVLRRPIGRLAMPASAVTLWILFCVCTGWVWPWYLVPALALAPAAGRRLLPAGAGLTLGGLLFWAAWPEARPWPLDAVYPWRSLLLFGPFLLVTFWAPARAAVLMAFGWQRRRPQRTTLLPEPVPLEPAPG
jgi:hypothetical protein